MLHDRHVKPHQSSTGSDLCRYPIVNNLKVHHVGIPKKTLGGSSYLGTVVNNRGDRKSPRPGVVGPLPNGRFMAYISGLLSTYLLR